MLVSYCSTCKGRLHQLQQVLHDNLERLRHVDADWIIVDYNCPDRTYDVLQEDPLVNEFIALGKLKLFKLTNEYDYHMTKSKNLSHLLSTGHVTYTLDCDNYIGDSFKYLAELKKREVYLYPFVRGTGGRFGMLREDFVEVGGYDESFIGAGGCDVDLRNRLSRLHFKFIDALDVAVCIPNTVEETAAFFPEPWQWYFDRNIKISRENLQCGRWIANRGKQVAYSVQLAGGQSADFKYEWGN